MKNTFALLILALICQTELYSQQVRFPDDYLGLWNGTLLMQPSGSTVNMSLQIGPAISGDSVYAYTLTYHGSKGDDVRAYEIRVLDRQRGLYEVDEKNSIRLPETLLGNKLISLFSVEGSSLLISLELHADEIIFEVYSWPEKNGQTGGGNDDTPEVKTYMANGYQRAVLKR